jgi:hypothetical protein
MSKSFKLKVAEPCHEDWQNMSPNAKGRHCQSCAKTVVDFSIMTNAEIISFFKNKPQNVCGRFTDKQLEKQYSIVKPSQSMSYARAAALAAGLFVAATGCQDLHNPQPKENMVQVDSTKLRLPENMRAIFGIVEYDNDYKRFINAGVTINDNIQKVYTDTSGKFVILINNNLTTVKLTVSAKGYKSEIFEIDLKNHDDEHELYIYLIEDRITNRFIDSDSGTFEMSGLNYTLGFATLKETNHADSIALVQWKQELVDNLLKQTKSKPQQKACFFNIKY